jgi:hypothetical protein
LDELLLLEEDKEGVMGVMGEAEAEKGVDKGGCGGV